MDINTHEIKKNETADNPLTLINTEDHYTHHITSDFSHATKILRDHESETNMHFSIYEVSQRFGETGKFRFPI